MENRPLCKCHGEPMHLNGKWWNCAVTARERSRGYWKKRYAADPQAQHERVQRWRDENPSKSKVMWVRRKGIPITVGEYEQMIDDQDGRCAICSSPPKDARGLRTPSVDHDHNTMAVRGLLCRNCNVGLGLLGDDLDSLLRAVEYLRGGGKPSK